MILTYIGILITAMMLAAIVGILTIGLQMLVYSNIQEFKQMFDENGNMVREHSRIVKRNAWIMGVGTFIIVTMGLWGAI